MHDCPPTASLWLASHCVHSEAVHAVHPVVLYSVSQAKTDNMDVIMRNNPRKTAYLSEMNY